MGIDEMAESSYYSTNGQQTYQRFSPSGVLQYTFAPRNYTAVEDSLVITKPPTRPKPSGWLFPMPYSREASITRSVNGKVVQVRPGYTDVWRGPVWSTLAGTSAYNMWPQGKSSLAKPFPNVDHVSQAEVKALNQLLTHGRERDGTFNVGMAWAERKETARLLENTASRLLQTLKDLKAGKAKKAFRELFPNGSSRDWKKLKGTPYWQWYKGRLKKAAKPLLPASLASGYLALENGWKPLLQDIHNATEALAFRNTLADWVITGKGYYKNASSDYTKETAGPGTQNAFSREDHFTRAVFVRIDCTVDNQHLHILKQLGLGNPASLMWEVTRLSYIFDYFVAVGDWLSSLDAARGMIFYSGSTTRFGELVSEVRSLPGTESRFSGRRWWRKFDRTPLKAFPVPIAPLSLKPQSLNLWQLGNIAAVATSLLTGTSADFRK